jgi:Holliday junction DNA helicase RuvB
MPRPHPKFHDFIGQRQQVVFIRKQVDGAMARGEPFPHTLLLGASGKGKTMLARAIASEMGTNVIDATGAADRDALVVKLAGLKARDVLYIDEAHRLDRDAQECLY